MKERGSVTLWILGLGLMLMALSGLSLDMWRLMDERRELAAIADGAAAAAASGIDEAKWRSTGDLALDVDVAEHRANRVIDIQKVPVDRPIGWFTIDGRTVVVALEREVELTLLRLVRPDPVILRASSRAEAQVRN